jgi:ABC-2 type transport system permease protein
VRRLAALTVKEFLHLWRDRLTLRLIVLVPLMQTIIFGYAINYDVKHLRTVVLDESKSFESRELVARMTATEYFDVLDHVESLEELGGAIDSGRASVGIVVDREFGRHYRSGAPAEAFLVVNASDTTTASQAMSIASGISQRLSVRLLAERAGWHHAEMPIDLRIRPWYNPELETATFVIPGLIAIILTFTLIQFTAMAIVRERERGTLEQLQVTPLGRTELIVGKIAPFVLIGYFQLTMALVLMWWLFGIPVRGSVVELYAVGFLFNASVLGLGMLISTVAQTQMQAMQLSFFFLLPFVFLSGYVFPIDGMPAAFRLVSRLIPARYFIEVLRGIILRGASVRELGEPIAWLAFYTVLITALAVLRFKKTAS